MASHRRPGLHRKPKPRTVVRSAATVVTAAATMTGVMTFAGTAAHADPAQEFQQTKDKVNALHAEVVEINESANGVQERLEKLQGENGKTQARVAEQQASMNELRDQIGLIAAEQYRKGGLPPELSLALSGDPDGYLQKARMVSQIDAQQAAKLRAIAAQARVLQQDRAEAATQLADLEKLRAELKERKASIQAKLGEAERLLNTLTEEQRKAVIESNEHEAEESSGSGGERSGASSPEQSRSSRNERPSGTGTTETGGGSTGGGSTGGAEKPDTTLPNVPASQKAAAAIAYAQSKIGKPYVPGAEGPNAFDCSGLTQAAWRAAGVKLSRTTWTQVNDGPRVSKSQLQPGDLVFFYSGNSHVGLYIGGGKVIHAPRPGRTITTMNVSSMPFYAAVRPG